MIFQTTAKSQYGPNLVALCPHTCFYKHELGEGSHGGYRMSNENGTSNFKKRSSAPTEPEGSIKDCRSDCILL